MDLRQEFELLKQEEDHTHPSAEDQSLQKQDFSQRKLSKEGTVFYFLRYPVDSRMSMATDGQFIYVHQPGIGLLKMSTGSSEHMMGQIFVNNAKYRNEEKVQLMYLNGKLYCRSEQMKPKPFVIVNVATLEEEKEEIEMEKVDKNLEWKENEDSGRSLTYTPIITDGNYVYVIA